jgi:hypothetical protein
MLKNLHGPFYLKGRNLMRVCPDDERGDNIEAEFTTVELAEEVATLLNASQDAGASSEVFILFPELVISELAELLEKRVKELEMVRNIRHRAEDKAEIGQHILCINRVGNQLWMAEAELTT